MRWLALMPVAATLLACAGTPAPPSTAARAPTAQRPSPNTPATGPTAQPAGRADAVLRGDLSAGPNGEIVGANGGLEGSPWHAPVGEPPTARCSVENVLPAGRYGEWPGDPLASCPSARWEVRAALSAGTELNRFLDGAPQLDLVPGYPWLSGLTQRRVSVVLARFVERDAAKRWLRGHLPHGGQLSRFRVRPASNVGEDEVVVVERDTDGYDESTAWAIASSAREEAASLRHELAKATTVCRIPAGSVHVFRAASPPEPVPGLPLPPPPEVTSDEGMIRPVLRPVRCPSGEEAWVLKHHTRAESVVFVDEANRAWLRQPIGKACGSMATVTWRWSNGRRWAPRLQTKRCINSTGIDLGP